MGRSRKRADNKKSKCAPSHNESANKESKSGSKFLFIISIIVVAALAFTFYSIKQRADEMNDEKYHVFYAKLDYPVYSEDDIGRTIALLNATNESRAGSYLKARFNITLSDVNASSDALGLELRNGVYVTKETTFNMRIIFYENRLVYVKFDTGSGISPFRTRDDSNEVISLFANYIDGIMGGGAKIAIFDEYIGSQNTL